MKDTNTNEEERKCRIKNSFVPSVLNRIVPPEEKVSSKSWEKELYQLIPKKHYIISRERHYEPIKDFIKQILSSHNARLIERVEGIREKFTGASANHNIHKCGYNDALDDVLDIIKIIREESNLQE